ncbi:MAG TPA: glycosyltransferase family 1 protein [Acidimicrobiales bacterium]|nr:glycosyltransferase family 1 protein [Acidimicrobiales bacterium]
MRVAVTLEQLWHRVPGGTARAAIDVAAAVAARGDVDQIGVAARHDGPPDEPWVSPIELRHLPLPRLALYEAWHGLRRPRVERATGPVDVVHATGVAVPPRSAPLVVTVHDLAVLHDPGHFTRHGVRFLRRAIDLTRRDADLVLCSSAATVADCERAGFRAERLRQVPLGVEVAPASPDDVARVRATHGLEGGYLLFVGTVEPRKNLATLLDAVARLDPAVVPRLVLVGPTGWGDDLGARIAALGDRCRPLGFVPAADLPGLYAGAAAFCYPSLLEGFGLPVLEAMAQGTPVVTSTGTATEELVAGGAGIAVDPRDPDAIAGALHRVVTDPALAAELAAVGRRRAAEHTWARTAELTVAAYREAAGR